MGEMTKINKMKQASLLAQQKPSVCQELVMRAYIDARCFVSF